MKLTRIAVVTAIAVAVAAPAASASIPTDAGTYSSPPTSGDSSRGSDHPARAADREAIATRDWERIAEPPVVALSPSAGNGVVGLPAFAAIAGLALVLLTLILFGRRTIKRRRTRVGTFA